MVVAANVVHGCKHINHTLSNLQDLLRPDGGYLLLLECTLNEPIHAIGFALLEGWSRFEDEDRLRDNVGLSPTTPPHSSPPLLFVPLPNDAFSHHAIARRYLSCLPRAGTSVCTGTLPECRRYLPWTWRTLWPSTCSSARRGVKEAEGRRRGMRSKEGQWREQGTLPEPGQTLCGQICAWTLSPALFLLLFLPSTPRRRPAMLVQSHTPPPSSLRALQALSERFCFTNCANAIPLQPYSHWCGLLPLKRGGAAFSTPVSGTSYRHSLGLKRY